MLGMLIAIPAAIICLALPIIIIVLIINAVKKSKEEGKSESFENVIKTIYLYILLIIFLCMIIVGIIGTVESFLDLYLPNAEFEEGVRGLNDQNRLKIDIITYIAVFAVSMPMFIIHNKKVKMNKLDENKV